MSGEEQTEIRHLWLKQIWFQTSAWIIVGIVWVFSALWFVIKWGFAPIALLVDFLILLPLGKLILKTPSKLEGKLIDEAELPHHVWEWMEQSRLRLLPDGYVNGQLIKIDHLAENQVLYALSLVHPEKKLGVSLNYREATKDTNKERLTDLTFAEFTLKCPDGSDMDLSNQQQVDPIPRIPGRQRYFFSRFGVQELNQHDISAQLEQMALLYNDGTFVASLKYVPDHRADSIRSRCNITTAPSLNWSVNGCAPPVSQHPLTGRMCFAVPSPPRCSPRGIHSRQLPMCSDIAI